MAAIKPTIPKAATLIRFTFMPTRRALSALPPTAKMERPNGVVQEVPLERVKQRVVLPWKPEDLRDNLIILRRRNARRGDYVEDLRVRRGMLRRILLLLTRQGEWRPGHGREALHLFYGDVDVRADHETEDVFPEECRYRRMLVFAEHGVNRH